MTAQAFRKLANEFPEKEMETERITYKAWIVAGPYRATQFINDFKYRPGTTSKQYTGEKCAVQAQ